MKNVNHYLKLAQERLDRLDPNACYARLPDDVSIAQVYATMALAAAQRDA